MVIDALLLDMDGLFRHWRDTGARTGERRAGLPAGTIDRYAYQHPSYRLAQLGVITDDDWAEDVADRLATDFGPTARTAITPWRADRGDIDPTMIDLAGQVRAHGLPVAILSNTTTAFRADLAHHGITTVFDQVFPSAELGVDKPAPQAFLLAAHHLDVLPQRIFFADDEAVYVAGARRAGMHAHRFTSPAGLAARLTLLGIPVTARPAAGRLAAAA
jgi:putative hydrolase of the HAD superfamily